MDKITPEEIKALTTLLEKAGVNATQIEETLRNVEKFGKQYLADLIKSQSELNNVYDLEQKILQITQNKYEQMQNLNAENAKLRSEMLDAINKQNEALQKKSALEAEINTLLNIEKDQHGVLSISQQQQLDKLREELKVEDKILADIRQQAEQLRKKLEAQRDLEKSIRAEADLTKNITTNLKMQMAEVSGLGDVFRSMNDGLSFSSALTKQFADNTANLFNVVQKGNVEFARLTGQIADRSWIQFGYGLSQYGIGFEELNKASIELFNNMSNFSNLNKDMREELAASAAKMELLGISAGTTGKILNNLTNGMRMSAKEAANTNEYLAKVAIGIGVAPRKMAEDFTAALPKMQAYGKQGVEVFAQLEKQAKSLGMEMNSLMGIVGDTFDTFEGGARAAGRLNAVLGGDYLNSVEMLNATESERIMLLKQSFDMSGKNFDSLDKYQKKAIAASIGITDLNEASKLFGSSTAQLTMDLQKNAASQKKLEEVEREAVETKKKMNEIFNAFLIIVRPFVSVIEGIVNVITRLNDEIGGFGGTLLATGLIFFKFGNIASSAFGIFKKFADFIPGIKTAFSGIGSVIGAPAIPTVDAAKASGFKGFLVALKEGLQEFASGGLKTLLGATIFASSMIILGGGLGLAAALVGKFANVNMVLAFGASMVALALALKIISAISDVKLLLGSSIFALSMVLIAVGLSDISKAMKQFSGIDFSQVMTGLGVVTLLIASMFGLGALLSTGAGAVLFGAGILGLIGLSVAFVALGAGLEKLSKGLTGLTEFTKALSSLSGAATGASLAVSAINEMGAALKELPSDKTVTLQALNETLNLSRNITEDQVKPTKEFVTAIKDYYIAQKDSKETDKDALVGALKELKQILTPKPTSNQPIMVKLVLNDGQVLTGKMFGEENVANIISGNGARK